MTETEKKALALVNEVCLSRVSDLGTCYHHELEEALCRAIEQHEAFRQEVSDALNSYYGINSCTPHRLLAPFILPKTDPLVEVIREMALTDATPEDADRLRAAMLARGYEFTKINKEQNQ